MAISKNEAAMALSEIDKTAGRSGVLRRYRMSGPILMVWGAVWIIGYMAMGLLPKAEWVAVWTVLNPIGLAISVLLARRGRTGARSAHGPRVLLEMLAGAAFLACFYVVFRPEFRLDRLAVYVALPGLLLGFGYIAVGIWRMPRLAWIGVAIALATMVGWYIFPSWMAFWMAGVGGGGLILGGLWLRRS